MKAKLIRDYTVEGFATIPAGTVVEIVELSSHGGAFFREGPQYPVFYARRRDLDYT